MKKNLAIVIVIVVIAAVGFAGLWFGRSNQQPSLLSTPVSLAPQKSAVVASATQPAAGGAKRTFQTPSAIVSNTSTSRQTSAVQSQPTATPDPSAGLHARIAARFDQMVSDNPKQAFQSPNASGHELVQTQPADPTWSPIVNQAIAERLNDDLGNQVNIESIDCKTDICELRVYGYLPDNQQGPDIFQKEMYDLQGQGWFGQHGLQFENLTMSSVDGGGPIVFIVYLTRK